MSETRSTAAQPHGHVVCAPDSFKGTLTAAEAAAAMARGAAAVWPGIRVVQLPLADGGEGSLEVMRTAAGGKLQTCTVPGPLGVPVEAQFLLLPNGAAVVELAQASGLLLVEPQRRQAELASTRGAGELIRAALDGGARRIIVCLGGSATTDGGTGLAAALGWRFLDGAGRPLPPGGTALRDLAHINGSQVDARLWDCEIIAATDVTNVLCGPTGAAAVYGPQKGASLDAVARLDTGLAKLAAVIRQDLGREIGGIPGAGAAGGTAAGLVAFLNARIESGAEVLMDAVQLPEVLKGAAVCLTGEGKFDAQTGQGKLISRLANRCALAAVPLVVIAGCLEGDTLFGDVEGSVAFASATVCPGPPPQAAQAAVLLEAATQRTCRLLSLGMQLGRDGIPAET